MALGVLHALDDLAARNMVQHWSERLARACEVLNGAATPGVVGALPDDLRAALEAEARTAAAALAEIRAMRVEVPQTAADVGGVPA